MTANKNEPDKKPAGSPSAQPAGRPHATLDLKATEVAPPAAAKDKPEVAEASAASKSASAASSAAASTSPPPKSSASATATNPAKSDKPASGTPPPSTPGRAVPPRAAPRGYGGFFTHVAAGVAGGVVALLAADMLASNLGLETAERPENLSAIEQRLGALEASRAQRAPNSAPNADVVARLAAAEAKLGTIEQLDANIDGVSKKQADLDRALNAVDEKIRTQAPDSKAAERLAKLEEQLSMMATAAERDPQSGRLPQLAALTGKLADLESTMSIQLDSLRKTVAQELDTRLGAAVEAGQAARSGTQRMDRDLSVLKSESAEMSNALTAVKTDSDRAAAALKTTQEDLKRLRADIDARLAVLAKPEDVASAVDPINTKLTALQQDVAGVMKSEGNRRTTAERIVLSLELANLKRAIDRGNAYAPELAQARQVAGTMVDLAPLERFALEGVPTSTELRQEFKPVAFKIIDAEEQPAEASIVDRLLAGAKSVVRVRKTSHADDDKSTEAIVSRMEVALNEDRFADVLQQAKSLPAPAQDAAQDFLAKVQAREAVDRALASVETQLKASLAAAPADANDNAPQ